MKTQAKAEKRYLAFDFRKFMARAIRFEGALSQGSIQQPVDSDSLPPSESSEMSPKSQNSGRLYHG